jgi:predicted transposase
MKQTLLVKLAPTPDQHVALLRTLEAFNAACNAIADVAFAQRTANKIALQRLVYYAIRQQFGLSAQMAIRAIAKVAEVYKRDRWPRGERLRASARGECCTVGRSLSCAPSLPTRRRWLGCAWCWSTRRTPVRRVAAVGIVSVPIVIPKPSSDAGRVASPAMPT